jgi:hypothetical protein
VVSLKTLLPYPRGERAHLMGRVDPKASLDYKEKRKIMFCQQSIPAVKPIALSIYKFVKRKKRMRYFEDGVCVSHQCLCPSVLGPTQYEYLYIIPPSVSAPFLKKLPY